MGGKTPVADREMHDMTRHSETCQYVLRHEMPWIFDGVKYLLQVLLRRTGPPSVQDGFTPPGVGKYRPGVMSFGWCSAAGANACGGHMIVTETRFILFLHVFALLWSWPPVHVIVSLRTGGSAGKRVTPRSYE